MRRDVLTLLLDIRSAGALLDEFTRDRSFEEYEDNAMLRAAAERQLEIIGEALRRALSLDPSLSGRITDSRRVVDFRNVLAHGYFAVSHDLVWGVVRGGWPVLRAEVDALVEEATEEGARQPLEELPVDEKPGGGGPRSEGSG